MGYTVVVSDKRRNDYSNEAQVLKKCGAELIVLDCRSEEDMIRECADADAILLDMAPMSRRVVESLTRCKVISRYGVGCDNVDIAACTEKGIILTNVPDYCLEDVSDMAMGLILCAARNIHNRDKRIRNGEWNLVFDNGMRLAGKTLSLLGAGRIGLTLVRKAAAFGFAEILVYDPYVKKEVLDAAGARSVSLEEAVSKADVLTLHMPVTPETKGMVNEKLLSMMKPTAMLINTSRGGLVDDEALISALKNHKIAAAGLDTHAHEPLGENSPYCELDNCVLTDHSAYYTPEALLELQIKTAEGALAVLEGKDPVYRVN